MNTTKKKGFDTVAFTFIAPAFIFFTLFIIIPTVSSVYYSFTSWDGVSPVVNFVGAANYKEIFTSTRFSNALRNTVILTFFISIVENAMALGLALIVDNVKWGKNFFRSAFYIPVLISGIVSGFIWKIMYNYNFGIFNAVLENLRLSNLKQDWLGNASLTLLMIGLVLIWKGVGYYMIIYLASLQSVSPDLIEAAQIDGASPVQRFKAITIPLISGAFTINFTLSLINGLKVFDQINVMTDGGPGFTSETLVYLLYKVGFNEGRQGFGTAVGIMLLFIIIILNTVQQKFLKSREVQM
ncbi:carbohydrate ABC transporter permease [Kineothrix sp. MB12-C1]|uniref:carbohydrate ABC transporter permease n=1 Tax=Kineothrix sp. MB12-C1 TaxID=3070215 RepID=UPI0027D31D3A|nr:sugar ABC transporter permease [Kineothrix sp. MB12-C1]WMC91936.1 sugar ABC transporter permease [Kineothrix sp. MB12-C1]